MANPLKNRPHGLSLNRMLPNILTMVALSAGLTGIRFALQGQWTAAVGAILVAAVLDGVDGRIARAMGRTTKFGSQLDSLADCVSFGVAPALLIYLWVEQNAGALGWIAVLAYTICAALRLARFNAGQDDSGDQPAWASGYFIGVPSPAAAGLALYPMIASFVFGPGFWTHPAFVGIWIVVVAGLMVAPLPTFSMKSARVPHPYMLPLLIVVGLFVAALVSETWATIMVLGVLYVATLPFSVRKFRRLQREAPADRPPHRSDREHSPDQRNAQGHGGTVVPMRTTDD